MDVVGYFGRCVDVAGRQVHALGTESWGRPTPCAEWDVRQVVAHLTEEMAWVPALLDGATVAEVGDRFSGDLLGTDPGAAWETWAGEAVRAGAGPGVPERTVHLSFGDVPGEEYLHQVGTDALIHSWDVARGAGREASLPDDLVEHAAAWFAGMEDAYRAAGAIGPRVELPDDADPAARLLAVFGRSPDWSP